MESLKEPYFFSFAQFLAAPREGKFLAALRRLPSRPLTPDEVAAQTKVDEARAQLQRFGVTEEPGTGTRLRSKWDRYDEAKLEQAVLLQALRTDHQRWVYDQAVKAGLIVPPQSIPDPRGDLEKEEEKERKAKAREAADKLLPECLQEAEALPLELEQIPDAVEDAALDYVENAIGRFYFKKHWALHRNPRKLADWLAEQGYAVDTDLVLAELDRIAQLPAWSA